MVWHILNSFFIVYNTIGGMAKSVGLEEMEIWKFCCQAEIARYEHRFF